MGRSGFRTAAAHRRWAAAALTLVAPAALVGCAAASPAVSPAVEPSLPAVVRVVDPAQLQARPLAAYLARPEQMVRIEAVRYTAMDSCLAGRGLRQRFQRPAALSGFVRALVADRALRSDLYGYFDVRNAPRRGYRRPASVPESVESAPPPGVDLAVVDACRRAGAAAVGGLASPTDLEDARLLPAGGPPVPSGDSRYRAVVARWRACLREHGFDYPDPVAAISDRRWRTPEPTREEVALASADVACKVATNLVGVGQAVQQATDLTYLQGHRAELEGLRSRIEALAGLYPDATPAAGPAAAAGSAQDPPRTGR